ncbi:hypothetical protein ABT282_07030 [Streptomyces sp. NPDC000927]
MSFPCLGLDSAVTDPEDYSPGGELQWDTLVDDEEYDRDLAS